MWTLGRVSSTTATATLRLMAPANRMTPSGAANSPAPGCGGRRWHPRCLRRQFEQQQRRRLQRCSANRHDGTFTDATESSVTLTGHSTPTARGHRQRHFEYGFEKTYGATLPCTPDPASSNFTEPQEVTATVTGFSPGTKDHYRLVATNAAGRPIRVWTRRSSQPSRRPSTGSPPPTLRRRRRNSRRRSTRTGSKRNTASNTAGDLLRADGARSRRYASQR